MNQEDLNELQDLTVKLLLERIREGIATASELNVARAILKDNAVFADMTRPEAPIFELGAVPFPAQNEDVG